MSNDTIYSNSQETQRRSAKVRRMRVKFAFLLLLPVIVLLGFLLPSSSTASNTTPAPVATVETKKLPSVTTPIDAGGQSQTSTNTVKKTAVSIKPVPNCTPSSNSGRSTAPTLTSASSGLILTPTIESRYVVYGDTTSQISNQIFRCSPVVSNGTRFAASADYVINWSFQYQSNEAGLCTISNASVGLGTSKILPKWQPVNAPSARLQNRWNSYISNLDAHENGHLKLNRTYAQKIVSELQNFPATSCDSINSGANARANAIVAELNRANDQYDASTDHGSTEGANL